MLNYCKYFLVSSLIIFNSSICFADFVVEDKGVGSKQYQETVKDDFKYKNMRGKCVVCDEKTLTKYIFRKFGVKEFIYENDDIYMVHFISNKQHFAGIGTKNIYCHQGTIFYRNHEGKIYFAIGAMIPNYENIDINNINNDSRFTEFKQLKWSPIENADTGVFRGWKYIVMKKS